LGVLLLFYRKKIDRSTQFGAIGYIITLYSSKSYVKSWKVRPNCFGGVHGLRLVNVEDKICTWFNSSTLTQTTMADDGTRGYR